MPPTFRRIARSSARTAGRATTQSALTRRTGPAAAARALQRAAGNSATAWILRGTGASGVRARETGTVKTSFDDCPKNAKDVIRERTGMAMAWVDYSIRQLDAILANPAKADPDLHALLRKHFHIGEGKRAERALQDVGTVRARFAKLRGAFRKDIPFECESSCDPANMPGYVTDYWIFGYGDIHVCPRFFTHDYKEQVVTIIHEMLHKYQDMDDHAYEWQGHYRTLSTEAAIKNPDSYGAFARDI